MVGYRFYRMIGFLSIHILICTYIFPRVRKNPILIGNDTGYGSCFYYFISFVLIPTFLLWLLTVVVNHGCYVLSQRVIILYGEFSNLQGNYSASVMFTLTYLKKKKKKWRVAFWRFGPILRSSQVI